jgi:hypothetical protein
MFGMPFISQLTLSTQFQKLDLRILREKTKNKNSKYKIQNTKTAKLGPSVSLNDNKNKTFMFKKLST